MFENVSSKFRVSIDHDQCVNCGHCIKKCSHGVYRKENNKILIESWKCTACLRCIFVCPRGAISVDSRNQYRKWILSLKRWVLTMLKREKKV